jgi:hypothetical protein
MKRSLVAVVLVTLVGILGVAGCSGATAVPPSRPSSDDLSPLAVDDSPLPTPTDATSASVSATAEVMPTVDATLGSIVGTISMDDRPVGILPATLYLGDPTGSNPIGAYVSLDITTAIQGYHSSDGSFIFPNVPPGTYSIVVWTPLKAHIVPDEETGVARLIEIKDNARTDVGHIAVPAMGD